MAIVRAYIRVSTEEQAEAGFSIPAQRERIAAFCLSQGWAEIVWYVEEGRSAKDLARPELQRLLQELVAGDVVLVYRLDRLTRSVLDLYSLLRRFERAGAAFRSVSEVYDTTTAIGRLFMTLVAALAQWERENLAERVKLGMNQAAGQGRRMGGSAPFGYDLAGGRLVVNPAEAAVVRQLFERYLQGEGVRTLVIWADRQDLRTKQGKPWSDYAMSYVLRNPVYAGVLRWGRQLTATGEIPALISPATYQAVQMAMAGRRSTPPRVAGSVYPLAGLLRCGLCGLPMHGRRRAGAGGSRFYACRSWEQHRACPVHRVGAEGLEAEVAARTAAVLPPCPEAVVTALAAELATGDGVGETARLRAEQQQLAARRRRWLAAFEQGVLGPADLKERLAELDGRGAAVADRLVQLENGGCLDLAAFRSRLADLPWVWERSNLAERKQIARAFVRSVVYRPGLPLDIQWHEPVSGL